MPEVIIDLPTRLKTAAATVRDAAKSHQLAVEARDELVVQAVEEGMKQRAVAQAAEVSHGRVTQILLKSHAVDD